MSKRNLKKFGQRIKDLRKQRGYTQAQLAERLDLSVNFVGMIERGERNTTVCKVFQLARGLDVAPNKLFEFE